MEVDPGVPPPSELRLNVLMYLPMATGTLSLIGSSLVLLSIYRSTVHAPLGSRCRNSIHRSTTRGQTSPVYHRILGVMSAYDIVYTLFSSMFGVLFKPQQSFTLSNGHGTRFTCTLQGFFIQWGYGCFAYGAWLSVYYVLTIRYNLPEATLARYVEPVIHASVFVFYFGTALIASAVGLMNPTSHAACWIVPYPLSCADFNVPCVRGANFKQAVLWIILIPSCTSVAVILVCLALVALTVWQQRNIVRKQHSKLPQPTTRSEAWRSTGTNFQPMHIARDSTSVDQSCVITGEPEPQPNQVAKLESNVPGNRPKPTSSVERLTNEAIGQCVFSGCTFVNSVIWTNLLYSFFIHGNASRRDQYWVRPSPCSFAVALACTHARDWLLAEQRANCYISPVARLFQFCSLYQTSLLRCTSQFSNVFTVVGIARGGLEPVFEGTRKKWWQCQERYLSSQRRGVAQKWC
jgi:hypothetical protein